MKFRFAAVLVVLFPASLAFGQSWVTSVTPAANSFATTTASIEVVFSQSIDPSSLTNSTVRIHGSQSGSHAATFNYAASAVSIQPLSPFLPGEIVRMTLTAEIRNMAGDAMPAPYSFRFSIGGTGGSGSFALTEHLAIPPAVVHINAHDVNADQWPDLTLLDDYPNNKWLFFLENTHGGPMVVASAAYVSWTPSFHALGDFTGDGLSDAAATRLDHPMIPLFQRSGGQFVEYGERYVGVGSRHVLIDDVDGNGWQDIVVSNPAIDSVIAFFNEGGSVSSLGMRLKAFHPAVTAVSDMNLDGLSDLVTTDPAGVRIFFNGGNRLFPDSALVPFGAEPVAFAIADLDADGHADLAVLDSQKNEVTVALNDGTGRFFPNAVFTVGTAPKALLVSDFNADHLPDLVTADSGSHTLTVLMNLGAGDFFARPRIPLQYGPTDIAAADWDHDGDIDLLAVSKGSNFLSVLLNKPPIPRITVFPDTVDFHGSLTDSAVRLPVTIKNTGGGSDIVARARLEGDAVFTLDTDSLVVAPDDSAVVWVNFLPPISRMFNASLFIDHNDPDTSELSIALTGYGLAVDSVSPVHQVIWNPDPEPLLVTFDESIDPSSVSNASVFVIGSRSGRIVLESVTWDGKTASIIPAKGFLGEEQVTVVLTRGIRTSLGDPIVKPFSWSFQVRSGNGTSVFDHAVIIAPDRDSFTEIHAGDHRQDSYIDLIALAPQTIYNFMGVEDGWVGTGGAGQQGAGSFADLGGAGGVGILSGTWTEAGYTYWGFDEATSMPMQKFVTLGPISDYANGSVSIDFDLDGDLDAAFCLLWKHQLQIYRNDGGLEFTTLPPQLLDGGPVALAGGDFDGDGYPDLVASTYGREAVAFCRNRGDGSFEIVARPYVGLSPLPSAVADFNNDGRLDVAVGAFEGASVSVLINKGGFTFERIVLNPNGKPRGLTAADFNGDGLIDLAAAIESRGAVVVWENRGEAGFVKILDRDLGSVAGGVCAVDFGRNGSADLIVSVDQTLVLLENKRPEPDLEFSSPLISFPNVALGTQRAKSFSLLNTGGRGDLEITDIRSTNPAFTVSATSFNLAIGTSAQVQLLFTPDSPRWFADSILVTSNDNDSPVMALPVYGTGIPVQDIEPGPFAMVDPGRDTIRITMVEDIDPSSINRGLRISSPWRVFPSAHWPSSYDPASKILTIAGLNAAKPGEAIMVSTTPGMTLSGSGLPMAPFSSIVSPRPVSGTGSFAAGELVGAFNVASSALADLDGDGDLDIATASFASNEVFVFLNSGGASFSLHQRISYLVDCIALCIADFDSDGDMDIAVSHQAWANAFTLLRNDGLGTFLPDETMYFYEPLYKIAAGDADGDGDVDVFADYGGSIIILYNDGSGLFTPYGTDMIGGNPVAVDFDRDGLLDIATSDFYTGTVRVYSSEGFGLYQLRYEGKPGRAAFPIDAGDFDNDGWCDLAVGGDTYDLTYAAMVLRNNRDWTFSMVASPAVSHSPKAIKAGDLDGDGDLDLVTANYDTTVSVVINRSDGFYERERHRVGAEPMSIEIGDLDADGDLDLAIGAYVGGSVHILLNGLPVGVQSSPTIPLSFNLYQNYPNPFNPATTIHFDLPTGVHARLEVYNILGERVMILADEELPPGKHSREWRAQVPSGVYFYRIQAGEFIAVKKMMLIR